MIQVKGGEQKGLRDQVDRENTGVNQVAREGRDSWGVTEIKEK